MASLRREDGQVRRWSMRVGAPLLVGGAVTFLVAMVVLAVWSDAPPEPKLALHAKHSEVRVGQAAAPARLQALEKREEVGAKRSGLDGLSIGSLGNGAGRAQGLRVEAPGVVSASGAGLSGALAHGAGGVGSFAALMVMPRDATTAESYAHVGDSGFRDPLSEPLSTFSVDVDTASYANVRRYLRAGQHPPQDAVRIEELLNYFTYDDAAPTDGRPFAVRMETATCPWQPEHRLVRLALKGKSVSHDARPASNLVFLVDVSGSMQADNKLPLLKDSLRLLVAELDRRDTVAMVVYAGSVGTVLPPTRGDRKADILAALDQLTAGGSTNGGDGIRAAYDLAASHYKDDGINRVILATDGDFNVGVTQRSDLIALIEKNATSGVFLTVLGVGMGNLKDGTLEQLADRGNGNYAYLDTHAEARKVLVEQLSGTLLTIAKDVKLQVEFNPAQVASYRLVGYENRRLAARDFDDDAKDAGEIGAGHSVVALYEVVPASGRPKKLKYRDTPVPEGSPELLTVKLRYKLPEAHESTLFELPMTDSGATFEQASADFRFAAAVALFGMGLRGSEHRGITELPRLYERVTELASTSLGRDTHGWRRELVELAQTAGALSGRGP